MHRSVKPPALAPAPCPPAREQDERDEARELAEMCAANLAFARVFGIEGGSQTEGANTLEELCIILKELDQVELGLFVVDVERFSANSQQVATKLLTVLPEKAP